MGKGTIVVAHEDTGTGTGIFYKCGYGDGHYSTLPIGYPLPSPILGIKGSKPNFTSRDDVFFPNPTDHYFPQEPTTIYLKG